MQSSGQQPTEEIGHGNEQVGNEIEQASLPFYEFPADNPQLQDASQSPQVTYQNHNDDRLNQPSEESILQGLVYPPPPSYYQNMQTLPARPALPLRPGSQTQLYPAGVQAPSYPPARYPGLQPPVKRSYKWIWIIGSIFTAALLVSGGLCGWAFYQLFNMVFQQESGASSVVNDYFQNVQNQRYANAYQDLQISGLTQSDYTEQARVSDSQNGLLQSFVVDQPTFVSDPGSGPDLSKWRFTVDVTRTGTSYPELLTVENIGGRWKITYIDKY